MPCAIPPLEGNLEDGTTMALWARDAGTRKKILVDNPTRPYQF